MEQNPEEAPSDNSPETENTIELTQESDNMEVHHHAHHDHGKKTWKSYFWEFFMLFLAVFCGFMAEVQVNIILSINESISICRCTWKI